LGNPKDLDTLSSELENRLDDLFGEEDLTQGEHEGSIPSADYPLAELKNLVLSIDWEITDEILQKFLQQLKDLKMTYQHDKIVVTFLQILNSLGDYIKTNRSKAHPKTFKILNAVFSNLDRVVNSKDMIETEKKKILRSEMNRYKKLRAQIAQSKAAARPTAKAVPVKLQKPQIKQAQEALSIPAEEIVLADEQITIPGQNPPVPVETLAEAVAEIKRFVQAEIKALREEIKSLRKQK